MSQIVDCEWRRCLGGGEQLHSHSLNDQYAQLNIII